jgi:hypothetical protein
MGYALGPLSLSEPLGDDSDAEFGDLLEDRSQLSPCDAAILALLPLEITVMLSALDEREQLVFSADSHEAVSDLTGPRLETERTDAGQLLWSGDLLGGTDDDHAPAGARRHVVLIDLERNRAVQHRRDQLLSRRGAEHHVGIEQRVHDWQHERSVCAHTDAPDSLRPQERFTLRAVKNVQPIAAHVEMVRADDQARTGPQVLLLTHAKAPTAAVPCASVVRRPATGIAANRRPPCCEPSIVSFESRLMQRNRIRILPSLPMEEGMKDVQESKPLF